MDYYLCLRQRYKNIRFINSQGCLRHEPRQDSHGKHEALDRPHLSAGADMQLGAQLAAAAVGVATHVSLEAGEGGGRGWPRAAGEAGVDGRGGA